MNTPGAGDCPAVFVIVDRTGEPTLLTGPPDRPGSEPEPEPGPHAHHRVPSRGGLLPARSCMTSPRRPRAALPGDLAAALASQTRAPATSPAGAPGHTQNQKQDQRERQAHERT